MYRYASVARRNFKIRRALGGGLVQDHHAIPREWRYHPVVRAVRYDFNSSENIVMMPTPLAFKRLNIRRDRLVHCGGHKKYNLYVGVWLDSIQEIQDPEEMLREFYSFRDFLKRNCRDNRDCIPWK
jgi:hypothetical protein